MSELSQTSKPTIKSHRDLIVWQKSMDLVVCQTRRAATSIPANVAEGQGRRLPKEFLCFLANARGSLWELDTHLESATRLGFLGVGEQNDLRRQMDEVGRILNGLMRSIMT